MKKVLNLVFYKRVKENINLTSWCQKDIHAFLQLTKTKYLSIIMLRLVLVRDQQSGAYVDKSIYNSVG